MPVRNAAPVEEAPTKRVSKPKEEKEVVKTSKKAPQEKEVSKKVEKHPFLARAKKTLNALIPGIADKVADELEKTLAVAGKQVPVAFIAFSEEDAENITIIKDLLFAYHTLPGEGKEGLTAFILEVLLPEEGTDDLTYVMVSES